MTQQELDQAVEATLCGFLDGFVSGIECPKKSFTDKQRHAYQMAYERGVSYYCYKAHPEEANA